MWTPPRAWHGGVLRKGWLISVGGGSSAHLPQCLTPGHFSHTGQPHAPYLVFHPCKIGIRAPFFQPWIRGKPCVPRCPSSGGPSPAVRVTQERFKVLVACVAR